MQIGDDDAIWIMQQITWSFFVQIYFCIIFKSLFLVITLSRMFLHYASIGLVCTPPSRKFKIDHSNIFVHEMSSSIVLKNVIVKSFCNGWLFSYGPFWKPPQMK
ncbi:unnamed protein product [Musa acuminata subsp. burmannicoides]